MTQKPAEGKEPSVKEIHADARRRMEKAVEDLRAELSVIRTGRASVNLLDHVKVDYYGDRKSVV